MTCVSFPRQYRGYEIAEHMIKINIPNVEKENLDRDDKPKSVLFLR